MFPDRILRDMVQDELSSYGQEGHEREGDRVRLAVLKVAGTSIEQIRDCLAIAKRDYRDVPACAEYPKQLVTPTWRLPADKHRSLEIEDAEQYRDWIEEPS